MELPFEIPAFVYEIHPFWYVAVAVLLVAIFYWRRTGLLLARLESENRRLRRGIQGFEKMEQDHADLSEESRERRRYQQTLPELVSRLSGERTVPGISSHLIDFASRSLGADEVSLFLREGSVLVLRDMRGIHEKGLKIAIGEATRIGLVGKFRRVMASDDFMGVDPATREKLMRKGKIDTVIAAPLLAHGELLGVLNVGGHVTSTPSIRKEVLSVVANLGATALENQLNFERLEREATTDGLTGLSNVRNFKEKLRQELVRAQRFGRPVSVFLFDIDNFKHYNDQNGHPAGDECLRITAELLRTNTRVTDLAARYGGEEFVILLTETDAEGALTCAEKIRSVIASTKYPAGEKQPLGCVSVSGGVATFPADGQDIETLIAAADRVLYACKEGGRNRVAAASVGEPEAARPRAARVS